MAEYFDKNFDPAKVRIKLVEWIRDFFAENGPDCNAVVAISGGKDSSVVAALCVEALGLERVFGVLLPNGIQKDIDASEKLVAHLGLKHCIINIKGAFDSTCEEIEAAGLTVTDQMRINLPARLRMATVYAVSQTMNGRVANTCNLSEDWVGYATRYGDGAGDFSPLSKLTVQEVIAIGEELGLPYDLVHKVPVDGLSPLTDEERLGFTYATLDRYIRTGVCEDKATKERIDRMRKNNAFKLHIFPQYMHDAPIKAWGAEL